MESLEIINRRLVEIYGKFMGSEEPNYRVVFSEDQFEKRRTKHTDEGFELLFAEVRELPKYRQWIHNKYILERCIIVPEGVETDLIGLYSYEPVWVFEDKHGNPLPPVWMAIQLIISSIHANAANAVGVKYRDPAIDEADPKIAMEVRDARLRALEESVFGNETNVGDALAYKEGVTVPSKITSTGEN